MPGGTFSKRNVPSAADMTVRASSSICTVAPGMGSPERELSSRPDSVTVAWAERVALDTAAMSSAYARKSIRLNICISINQVPRRRADERAPHALRGEETLTAPAAQREAAHCGVNRMATRLVVLEEIGAAAARPEHCAQR